MSGGGDWLGDPAATAHVGEALALRLRPGDVVLIDGDLGAGKTTLARAVLNGLGLVGDAPSPSFAIVIDYRPPDVRLGLLHVDLYRLEHPDELAELGLDDAGGDAAMLIEWPSRAGEGRWPDALRLALRAEGEGRRLTWSVPPAWEGRWPPPSR